MVGNVLEHGVSTWGYRGGGADKKEDIIRFGTYNIQNGFKGGLESELRSMAQENIYLGILKEKKIIDGVYARESVGFFVVVSEAPSRLCGGMALFHEELLRLSVEACQQQGPNVTIFQLVTGG